MEENSWQKYRTRFFSQKLGEMYFALRAVAGGPCKSFHINAEINKTAYAKLNPFLTAARGRLRSPVYKISIHYG